MKSLVNSILLTFILTNVNYTQWNLINPSTSGQHLVSNCSVGNSHWAVGTNGAIVFSSNGGTTWTTQNSTVLKNLNSVFFVSSNQGLIVGDEGVVLRTTNAGEIWELIQTTTNYDLHSVYFVSENIGWAAGGIQTGLNTSSITLKTTDGGLNWVSQYNSSSNIYSIYFLNENTGFTAGYNIHFGSTIKKTINGGASWVEISPNISTHYRDVYFINDNVGFCVGTEKVVRTTDGGNTWTLCDGNFLYKTHKKVKFVNDNLGWIVSGRSAFRTTDGGYNWVEYILPELKSSNPYYTVYNSIAISNQDIYLVANYGSIIKSTNTGLTWIILSGILNEFFDIQFLDSLNGFVAASKGFIYSTNDGGANWSSKVTPTNRDILNLKMSDHSTGFATTDNEILKTTNGGQSWLKKSFIPNHQYLCLNDIYFVDNSNGWACGNYSTIVHSSDGGESWQVQLEDNGSDEIKSIYFHDELNGLAIGLTAGQYNWKYILYSTADGGKNWVTKDLEIEEGYGESKILFLNEQIGWLLLNNRIMATSDGGATWFAKFILDDYISFLDMSVIDQNKFWITDWYGNILSSLNNGETWGVQGRYREPYHIMRSISMVNDQIGWFTGSPNIIFKTYNGGQGNSAQPVLPVLKLPLNGAVLQGEFWYSWERCEDCLSRLQISTDSSFQSLEFEGHYISSRISAYSTCNYIINTKYYWRVRTENELLSSEWSEVRSFTAGQNISGIEEETSPLQYNLDQNYPNPFNPVTSISYSLPSKVTVKIIVYDLLGREVRNLVNEEKPAGKYEIKWDASYLPSGVYFYQIQAVDFIQTKKMILLK